jgi:hypothetical protein
LTWDEFYLELFEVKLAVFYEVLFKVLFNLEVELLGTETLLSVLLEAYECIFLIKFSIL